MLAVIMSVKSSTIIFDRLFYQKTKRKKNISLQLKFSNTVRGCLYVGIICIYITAIILFMSLILF